jgi:hypothetical protein
LSLSSDFLVSKFAFNCNLYHYRLCANFIIEDVNEATFLSYQSFVVGLYKRVHGTTQTLYKLNKLFTS